MRHTNSCWILVAALLAAVAPAQKITVRENDAIQDDGTTRSQTWHALWLAAPRNEHWTGIGMRLANYGPAVALRFGVFGQNPSGAGPGTLLGSGTMTLPQAVGVPVWAHARLDAPVPVVGGRSYYVGVQLPSMDVRTLWADRGGDVVRHWWWRSSTGTWFTDTRHPNHVKLRVYAGTHAGADVTFGAGQAGTGGVVPELVFSGFANTTDPLNLRIVAVPVGATVVFLLGRRTSSPFPLFPLHVEPWDAVVAAARQWTPALPWGEAFADWEATVPDAPSLHGARLAIQGACVDAEAPFGLSSTPAIELTIGG